MSANNGSKNVGPGVWALVSTTGGLSMLCKFDRQFDRDKIESIMESGSGWVPIENAYTFMLIPGNSNGRPTVAPMCVPFGQMVGEHQKIALQVQNLVSVAFFDDMDPKTRSMYEAHVSNARNFVTQLSAAASGILTR